jgi:adenine-specific DNA glycosylase
MVGRGPGEAFFQLSPGLGIARSGEDVSVGAARRLRFADLPVILRTDHADALAGEGAPTEEAESLRALPGIGAYTAGAVSSFAYERRAELVDTNVARVLKRVFAPDVELKTGRGQKRLWAIARDLLPRTGKTTWTHNQALMELGALECTARIAHCGACPVRTVCATYGRASDDASVTETTKATRRAAARRSRARAADCR